MRATSWVSIVVAGLLLAGCVATAPTVPAKSELQFLDVAGFDRDLSASLGQQLPRVEVGFSDRVTPSNLPVRLQKWLESVDKGGGKVAVVEPPSTVAAKSPLLVIGAISTLWSAQKTVREAGEQLDLRAASRYDAQLRLKSDRGDIVVDKVVFTHRP